MKNTQSSSAVGSSIKSSLNRFLHDSLFRGIIYVTLCMMLCYMSLWVVGEGLEASIVSTNTSELPNDGSIEQVSYINENGKVFLDNGNAYDSSVYQYTKILYGNEYWFSENERVLASPMTLKQCVFEMGIFELMSGVYFLFVLLLIKMLSVGGIKGYNHNIQFKIALILYIIYWICEFSSVFPLARLLVNNRVLYVICGLTMSFVCAAKVGVLKLLIDKVVK